MNRQQTPFVRKIIYLAIIAGLLYPLTLLGKPSTADATGRFKSKGGMLAQLRDENHLGQANLGEIDPSSEAIKLATLGMRGVAVNVLWTKVNHYRKVEDWTSMSATLEQIKKLQPNFIAAWRFQGWNLAYNISVEFDDYRDRYYWVIRGINFLKEGTEYNEREPILLWDMGHFISQKIGRSDEHRLFRKMFVADDDFHGNRPYGERDNWLVGRGKFLETEQAIADGKKMKGQSPLIYFSNAPLCLIYYAIALEEEGQFNEATRNAWDQAAKSWQAYGQRELPDAEGKPYRMAEMENHAAKWGEIRKQLSDLVGDDVEAQLVAQLREALPAEAKEALDTRPEDRSIQQHQKALMAAQQLVVTSQNLAKAAPPEKRSAAQKLADEADQKLALVQYIDTSRNIVNYLYWLARCQAERTDTALAAHQALFEADKAYRDVEFELAVELYEKSFQSWRKLLDEYRPLMADSALGEDLVRSIKRYERCLKELKQDFPQPFILQDVRDEHEMVEPGTQAPKPAG
ncbi:MAG: hypothetical protein JNG90_12080 [Planctomycetaceae bacterium]|nr:hypothetical protein [Planctomycetaceae bacterium]